MLKTTKKDQIDNVHFMLKEGKLETKATTKAHPLDVPSCTNTLALLGLERLRVSLSSLRPDAESTFRSMTKNQLAGILGSVTHMEISSHLVTKAWLELQDTFRYFHELRRRPLLAMKFKPIVDQNVTVVPDYGPPGAGVFDRVVENNFVVAIRHWTGATIPFKHLTSTADASEIIENSHEDTARLRDLASGAEYPLKIKFAEAGVAVSKWFRLNLTSVGQDYSDWATNIRNILAARVPALENDINAEPAIRVRLNNKKRPRALVDAAGRTSSSSCTIPAAGGPAEHESTTLDWEEKEEDENEELPAPRASQFPPPPPGGYGGTFEP